MTPTQRAAAERLADDLQRFDGAERESLRDEAAAILRELLAEPQSEPGAAYKQGYEDALNDCIRNGLEWARGMFANDAEHIKTAEPQGEPVAWHVCSVNSDGSLSLEFAAPWEELAHEHINDAINEHDIDGAASWVVRPVYASPQPQQTEPSQNTHPPQQRKPPREQITAAAKALCRQASTACNVDFDDNWKVYGDNYIADATAALNAAYGIGEAP